MDTSFLFDKSQEPAQKELHQLLGKSSEFLIARDDFLELEFGKINFLWKFYTKKSGWTRKAMLKKRNLFLLTPKQNEFWITFVFGERAVETVEESDLPENIKSSLREAKKYMEGSRLRVDVENEQDLETVKKLLKIKVEN